MGLSSNGSGFMVIPVEKGEVRPKPSSSSKTSSNAVKSIPCWWVKQKVWVLRVWAC